MAALHDTMIIQREGSKDGDIDVDNLHGECQWRGLGGEGSNGDKLHTDC